MELVVEREGARVVFDLSAKTQWIIGRSPNSDILLNSSEVSRCHATITRYGSLFLIIDGCEVNGVREKSRNGLFLNNLLISEALLKAGDILKIGGFTLSLFSQEATDAHSTSH